MIRFGRFLTMALVGWAITPMQTALAQGDTAIVVCGEAPLLPTYCYVASDAQTWNYQSSGTGTLRLKFLQGTIENAVWDSLEIYDGTDATGTLLYQHSDATVNLGPEGSGTNNGIVIFDAVEVYSTTGSFFMLMNSDFSNECNSPTTYDPWEWEVVCLDCTIPVVSHTIVDDCANNQFSIPVEVTNTGDGAVVNIVYSVNGGAPQTLTGVGVGMSELGPFSINDVVNVVIEHENNFLCNVDLGDLTDTGTCPTLINCGTEWTDQLCYADNIDQRYYYQGTGTVPIAMYFAQGLITAGDTVIVYDGADITAPRLFTSMGNFDLTNRLYVSANPEHRLTLRILSNGFTSCATSGVQVPINWAVTCYDCVPASVSFNLIQDCINEMFSIDVAISDLGSSSLIGVANTVTGDTLFVNTVGTTVIGPFPPGTEVDITVVNFENSLCNVYSSPFAYPLCPDSVACPGPGLEETYCYTASDRQEWAYALDGGPGSMRLTFDRGTIESAVFDRIYIFDGADDNAPILWSNAALYPNAGGAPTGFVQQSTGNLGPQGSALLNGNENYFEVDVAASGQNLYMIMESDGSVECSGGFNYDSWEWRVYCLNCSNPETTVNVVPDCVHRAYNVEVVVTDAGGDADLSITNLSSGDTLANVGVGVHQFGPFPLDSLSVIRVFNQEYPQCRSTSQPVTYAVDSCVIVSCGVDAYEYCYGNNEDRWYTYKSAINGPITIRFSQGQLLAGDLITIYNGLSASANTLFQGNNNGGSFAGFELNSQNTDYALTLRIRSNDTGSCEDNGVAVPLQWAIGCGAIGIDEFTNGSFSVYPNPTEGLLQIELGKKVEGKVQLRITDMSGRIVMEQQLLMNGGTRNAVDMTKLQSGQYLVQLTTPVWVKTERVQVAR